MKRNKKKVHELKINIKFKEKYKKIKKLIKNIFVYILCFMH